MVQTLLRKINCNMVLVCPGATVCLYVSLPPFPQYNSYEHVGVWGLNIVCIGWSIYDGIVWVRSKVDGLRRDLYVVKSKALKP